MGIELMEHRAIVNVPEDAIEIELNCKVFHNGEIVNVGKVMKLSDIREAFRKADNGYIDDDDRYMITEKGLKWLEENAVE